MRVILSTSAGKTIWYGNGKTPGSGSFPMKHWLCGAAGAAAQPLAPAGVSRRSAYSGVSSATEEQEIEVGAQQLVGASTVAGFAGNDPEKVEALQPNLEEEREPGAAIAEALGLPKPLASVPVDREREEDEEGPL